MLVLDDYHVIDARDIHDGMVFLLDHLPPRLHLVIASRTDPPLPLARLRARGELTEVRAGFAGDDHYIVDYLAEEVLQRQPSQIREFLLRTSVLDRLSGSLCNAVTGQHDGKAILETLQRANLFVVPHDRRRWYRYHHLFADVLRARLLEEQPETMPR